MKNKKWAAFVLIFAALCLFLSGCVPGDGANSASNTAGFFMGVWHGWIAPFSLVYSLFKDGIRIYETYNNGFRYDLGYYMAVISGFGGLALSRRGKKKEG